MFAFTKSIVRYFVTFVLTTALLTSTGSAAIVHVVKKGETISSIAVAYNLSVKQIKDANNLRDADRISIGQELSIPIDSQGVLEYTIRKGDSLSQIAQRYGITLKQLSAFNGIANANKIRVGQVIKIPTGGGTSEPTTSTLPRTLQKDLSRIRVKSSQWKHIVIHHSASRVGSAESFDRFHREERGMENGLAYHFVIGNGRGMENGEIAIGDRWKRQIQGGHLTSYALNQISIGICLVGDFEKTSPTSKQMEQLEALVKWLMAETGVPASRVTTHTLIHPKHTACPGRFFPIESFKRSLQN